MRLIPTLLTLAACGSASALAKTDKYRLIWNASPHSSITVAWCQQGGGGGEVQYREVGADVPPLTHGVDRETSHLGLESRFARLAGLKPETTYEFVIRDSDSKSPRFTFTTASAGEASFSFVAGGDSRNHRDARQRANRTVAKLRPLFVCFGGDMVSKPVMKDWAEWLDDWQLTGGDAGQMIPIIAARGNHEGAKDIHAFFDTPNPDDYYAVDFGSGFLRVYTLNSNIVRAGSQGRWLAEDLASNAAARWKVAQYHHPFLPHHSEKAEQYAQYNAWAPSFFEHGMDLAIECDSHVVKRTWPIRPSTGPGSDQGFIRDDAFGTVFIGEGCWGAPLRRNDDDKAWTRASASFNQVNWICVTPERLFTRTVKVDSIGAAGEKDPDDPFALPEGLEIWEPESGGVVSLSPRGKNGRPAIGPADLARINIVAEAEPFASSTMVRLVVAGAPGDAAEIRYTLDGSVPEAGSARYDKPIEITATTTVRAAIFRGGKAVSAISQATLIRAGGE